MENPDSSPSPEWRAARHRLRNDLQMLASLLRLGQRRAAPEDLLDAFPEWLRAMATVYDLLPAPDGASLSLYALASALDASNRAAILGDALLPGEAASAAALAADSLLAFGRNAAAPESDIIMEIAGGGDISMRVTIRPAREDPPAAPSLGLELAAEALGGRVTLEPAPGRLTLSLIFPCP
jgi:hypothetical protein